MQKKVGATSLTHDVMDLDQENLHGGKQMMPLGPKDQDPKQQKVYEVSTGKENADDRAQVHNDDDGESWLDASLGPSAQQSYPKPVPHPIFLGPGPRMVRQVGDQCHQLASWLFLVSDQTPSQSLLAPVAQSRVYGTRDIQIW